MVVAQAEPGTIPPVAARADELGALAARLAEAWPGTDEDLEPLRAAAAESGVLDGVWSDLAGRLERHGAAVVEGVPAASDALLLALAFGVGTPTAVGNGDRLIYDVRPRPLLEQGDISTTRAAFPLHTDSTALVRPHDVIALACLDAPPGGGGESLIATVDSLRAALPDDVLARLAEPAFPFPLNDPSHGKGVRHAPVLDRSGVIRYRRDALEVGERASGEPLPARSRAALDRLDEALRDPSVISTCVLRPGDVLFVDNRRSLHGRTAIRDGADRHLRRLKLFATV